MGVRYAALMGDDILGINGLALNCRMALVVDTITITDYTYELPLPLYSMQGWFVDISQDIYRS